MKFRAPLAALALAALFATSAQAQFKLYQTPRGIQAANAAAIAKASDAPRLQDQRPGQRPLSPLGGPQGTPQTIQPAAPATALQANGDPAAAGRTANPAIEDPNKPRQPLKPKSLTQGVAPR